MNRATCLSCTWWLLQPDMTTRDGARLGQCREQSPSAVTRSDATIVTRWPLTVEHDFCGSHGATEVAA